MDEILRTRACRELAYWRMFVAKTEDDRSKARVDFFDAYAAEIAALDAAYPIKEAADGS